MKVPLEFRSQFLPPGGATTCITYRTTACHRMLVAGQQAHSANGSPLFINRTYRPYRVRPKLQLHQVNPVVPDRAASSLSREDITLLSRLPGTTGNPKVSLIGVNTGWSRGCYKVAVSLYYPLDVDRVNFSCD